jgi:signal transduction histidine kinase
VKGWVILAACAGQLFLGFLALVRAAQSAVALPLALLSFDFFAWNFADFAYDTSGQWTWKWVDHLFSPLTSAFALHFVLAYTGQRRRLAPVLWAGYLYMGALSAAAVPAFFTDWGASFQRHEAWGWLHLAGATGLMSVAAGALMVDLRRRDDETRRGTRAILAALAITVPLALTELLQTYSVPALGSLGTLSAVVFIGAVALRLRLFSRDLATSSTAQAACLALLLIVAYVASFQLLVVSTALLVFGTATAVLFLVVIGRWTLREHADVQARQARLAMLGRFAAQMAHDLKNPLAAVKGAVQFLQEERTRGRPLDEHAGFLDLMAAQLVRMQSTVHEYQRLGRMEVAVTRFDLNDLVRDVVALPDVDGAGGVAVGLQLDSATPELDGDRDLLARAIENLVRNAVEAMPAGGRLDISTQLTDATVLVTVVDSGVGMDPSTVESAFDEFFTTKASGTGLGLPFVRRVAEAHGGRVSLTSRRGRGTRIELQLPVGPPSREGAR